MNSSDSEIDHHRVFLPSCFADTGPTVQASLANLARKVEDELTERYDRRSIKVKNTYNYSNDIKFMVLSTDKKSFCILLETGDLYLHSIINFSIKDPIFRIEGSIHEILFSTNSKNLLVGLNGSEISIFDIKNNLWREKIDIRTKIASMMVCVYEDQEVLFVSDVLGKLRAYSSSLNEIPEVLQQLPEDIKLRTCKMKLDVGWIGIFLTKTEKNVFKIYTLLTSQKKIYNFELDDKRILDFNIGPFWELVLLREEDIIFVVNCCNNIDLTDNSVYFLEKRDCKGEIFLLHNDRFVYFGENNDILESPSIFLAPQLGSRSKFNDRILMARYEWNHKGKLILSIGKYDIWIANEKTLTNLYLSNDMINLLTKHMEGVRTVAISPDSKMAATASSNIKLWEVSSSKLVKEIEIPDATTIDSFIFTNDGKKAITAGNTNYIYEVDLTTFEIEIFAEVKNDIKQLALYQSDNILFATLWEGGYIILDYQKKKVIREFLEIHSGNVINAIMTLDGRYIISNDSIGHLQIYDQAIDQISFERDNENNIVFLGALPDSKTVVMIRDNYLYKLFLDKNITTLYYTAPINIDFACFVEDYQKMIFVGKKDLILYDLIKSQIIRRLFSVLSEGQVWNMALSPDQTFLLFGTSANEVYVMNLIKSFTCKSINAEESERYAFSVYENNLFTIKESELVVYDINTLETKIAPNYQELKILKKENEFDYIIATQENNTLILNANTLEVDFILKSPHGENPIRDFAICKTGNYFLTVHSSQIKLWDFKTKSQVMSRETTDILNRQTFSICFYNDDNFVTGHNDGSLKLWDANKLTVQRMFKGIHVSYVMAIDVTKDCQFMVTCGGDQTFRLWDLSNLLIIHNFTNAHSAFINHVSFSFDDNYILTASDDETSQVWSVHTRKHLYTFRTNSKDNSNNLIQMNKDGNKLFVFTDKSIIYCCEVSFKQTSIYNNKMNYQLLCFRPDVEKKIEDIIIFPYSWNILHYYAIFSPNSIQNVRADQNFTFMLDKYEKTPLHYLLAHRDNNILKAANHLFELILIYLEKAEISNPSDFLRTMKSLGEIFNDIIKTIYSSDNLLKFLNYCYGRVYPITYQEIDAYGEKKSDKVLIMKTQVVPNNKDLLTLYANEGPNKIVFEGTRIPIDFNLRSDFADSLFLMLDDEDRRFLIENQIISTIIDYYWKENRGFQILNLAVFSLLMLFYTIFISASENFFYIGILDSFLALSLLFYEIIQLKINSFSGYFSNMWNYVDLSCLVLIPFTISCKIYPEYLNIEEIYVDWLFIFNLIFGYLRWISYFRVIDSTRNLIRTILVIFADMKSFLIVLFFILLGFCSTLMVFRDDDSGLLENLYKSYFLLYSPLDGDMSTSQMIIAMIYPFVLNVVFLNMLISIMGDSFEKVQEKMQYTDNKERIELMSESCKVLRYVLGPSKPAMKYLIRANYERGSNDDDWAGKMKAISNSISLIQDNMKKNIEDVNKSMLNELKTDLENTSKEVIKIEKNFESKLQNFEKKIIEINDNIEQSIKARAKEEKDIMEFIEKKMNEQIQMLLQKMNEVSHQQHD